MRARLTRLFALALLVAGLAGCEKDLPVGEKDKAMFLRVADLVDYGYDHAHPEDFAKFERFAKKRAFDGSYTLDYEFETPASERQAPLFLSVMVAIERKASDARMALGAQKVGLMYGLRSSGLVAREIEGFHRYGDSSAFYVLEMDRRPVGNMYLVRDGKRLYTLTMSGMYFDDKATWAELVEGKLKAFSAYDPD